MPLPPHRMTAGGASRALVVERGEVPKRIETNQYAPFIRSE
jgi:hypothetical protein